MIARPLLQMKGIQDYLQAQKWYRGGLYGVPPPFDSTHTSHTRLPSPIARNSNGSPNRTLRLSPVGHVPHSFVMKGLSAPPTIPLAKP